MSSSIKLGNLIDHEDESANRDAIHVAVVPVIAGCAMEPGDHIGFDENREKMVTVPYEGEYLGVADPFMKDMIRAGDRFWMFLFPETVTDMRHHWSHPAFADDSGKPTVSASKKKASEEWLRGFCDSANCPSYDTMIKLLTSGSCEETDDGYSYTISGRIDDEYFAIGGEDASGGIPGEFWDHAEIVTGIKFPERAKYFSCSC